MYFGSATIFDKIASYEDKGLFADLYDFIDRDPDISRDDLLTCVRAPFEKDGKLYKAITNFSVNTLVGKTENLRDVEDSWIIASMINYANSLPDETVLLYSHTKESAMNVFATVGRDEFIDRETKECHFDSEGFIRLLEYANSLPVTSSKLAGVAIDSNRYAKYRNNEVILENIELLYMNDYKEQQYRFGTEDLTFIGFPSSYGRAMVMPKQSYAISSKSSPEIQASAWGVIKSMLLDMTLYEQDYSLENYHIYARGFPATYKALDGYAKINQNVEYIYFEDGNKSMNFYTTLDDGTEIKKMAYEMFGYSYETAITVETRITDEDIAFIKSYLESVTTSIQYDAKIVSIIEEESAPYFAGQKSAADAAKIIQSRVSIYISESK